MRDLNLTLIQSPLVWEDKQANLSHFENLLLKNVNDTDLIILPEMFTSGFTMNVTAMAESMSGKSVQWMIEQADRYQAVVCGSLIIKEEDRFFNRLIWASPEGGIEKYDKRHLFSLTKEPEVFNGGNERLIASLHGWSICPLICYDLRFPVWSRNTKDYDLLIYVANWPGKRSYAWNSLLKARAIENICYVAGVNCVGVDGNGIPYSGDSALIDPLGELVYSKANDPFVKTLTLSSQHLNETRLKFPFLADRDEFTLIE